MSRKEKEGTIKEVYTESVMDLVTTHSVREKKTMLKWVFEDLFGYHDVHSSEPFALDYEDVLIEAVRQLNTNVPVQYITGEADFYGHRFYVNRNVLIPRSETEELVEHARKFLQDKSDYPVVLDIGTGSGCIAITLKKFFPQSEVFGSDISEEALQVATRNALKLNCDITWIRESFSDPGEIMLSHKWDVIISNPPYINMEEWKKMDVSVREFEPAQALFAPNDNVMQVYQQILNFSIQNLARGGAVFLELNEFYALEINTLAQRIGFSEVLLEEDLQGKERMLSCKK